MPRTQGVPDWASELRRQFATGQAQDRRTIRSEARRIGITDRTLRLYLNGRPPRRLHAGTAAKFRAAGYRLGACVADEERLAAVGLAQPVREQLSPSVREIVEHPAYQKGHLQFLAERAGYFEQLCHDHPELPRHRILDDLLASTTIAPAVWWSLGAAPATSDK